MKRRHFLGRVGWILAALGLNEAGWWRLGDRYYQALAQPTPRKLALLVGINQYPSSPTLSGCITDVELQQGLLIHRFGFKAEDILTLTEQQATRKQIETAFLEHLTKQAQPGDVVVFHFSGYGRRIQLSEELENPSSPLTLNTLVPVDGVHPEAEGSIVNDLPEETLRLLLRSLSTNHITTILDTSFNTPTTPLQGNLRVRSFPQITQGQINSAELEFQQQLRQSPKHQISLTPGMVLAAAGATQLATEAKWAGFSAGLFTYALTQYLWEATGTTTVQVSLNRVCGVVEQIMGKEQQPTLSGQKSQEKSLLPYDLQPEPSIGADGVIVAVEEDGKTVHLWLAGLLPSVLEYYTAGAKLTLVSSSLNNQSVRDERLETQLKLRSRTGLTAKAQVTSNPSAKSLEVGQLIQEAVRVLPRNIKLNIALGADLERIERVDATSAFAATPFVSLVLAGEQPADYVFGRVFETNPSESSTNLLTPASPSRYGLFSLGQELIPNTAGEAGEAVKVAVHRLASKLQTLLAAKLWRLTTNEGSSRLNVQARLEVVNATERVLMQRETLRSPFANANESKLHLKSTSITATTGIPTVPIGSRIQYRVCNHSDRPVYLLLLGLDSSKNAIALYCATPAPSTNDSEVKLLLQDLAIAPGETLIVPQPKIGFEWVIRGPVGLVENQLIFSRASFTQTLAALANGTHPLVEQQQISPLLNPLEVAQAMMQDLHNASTSMSQRIAEGTAAEAVNSTAETYMLDVNQWASLSFIYQIV